MNTAKRCTMNCSTATWDTRTRAQIMEDCEDCDTIKLPHPDDTAVDTFARAMKDKLASCREQGRTGWQTASASHLSSLLAGHIEKGDPVDVANLCMMIHQNGQSIVAPSQNQLLEQLAMTLATIEQMVIQNSSGTAEVQNAS